MLAFLRSITKLIDKLRDKLRLDLNDMSSQLNKVHDRNQTMLQHSKLQNKLQAVPVSDLSLYKVNPHKIFVSSDLVPDLDPF